jgi:hypothetical protein
MVHELGKSVWPYTSVGLKRVKTYFPIPEVNSDSIFGFYASKYVGENTGA